MPANKEAVIRHRIIDRMLASGTYPSLLDLIDELSEQLGKAFSESTIQKDLKNMREDPLLGYMAPIAYSKREKGYHYTDPNYTISGIPLRSEDVQAIEFAALVLQQYKDVGAFRNFGYAADKIFNALKISTALDVDDAEQKVQVEQPPYFKGSEHLDTLLHAVRERQVVRFIYQKFTGEAAKERIIHPYLLKEHKNRWYLIGKDAKDTVKTFGLDRMERVTIDSQTPFETDFRFSPKTYFQHAYGIITFSGEPQTVRLRFSKTDGQYVKTVPLHPTQTVEEETDTHVLVQLKVGITRELVLDLLGYGPGVEVLEPQSLRKKIADYTKQMHDLYQ